MSDASFPSRLRQARKTKGYTQAAVAEAIGVTVQAVSLWETGQSGASHERILLLGELLGVDWDWLGYGADVTDPEVTQTLNIETPGDYQRGPMCRREEISAWVRNFPELDIEIADALDFESYDEKFDFNREWFEPRFPPTGIIFCIGIQTLSMDTMFVRGDVIICDTGIKPVPGDYVVAHFLSESRTVFRRLRQKRSENGSLINELVAENADYPALICDGRDEGRIVGTMIEHRRYRTRRGKELLDFLEATRKGISSDA